MICSVCSNEISGNYCSKCGQYFKNERISTRTIVTDLFGNIFSLEKSFIKNIVIGLTNPKILISNYWKGFRGYYYSPSKFLAIASLFFLVQIMIFNDFLGVIVTSKFAQQFSLIFIVVLLFSISGFINYLNYKKSFYEHLILNIYNVSLFSIVFSPISVVLNLLNSHKTIKFGFLFLFLLFIIIWNSRVFKMSQIKRFFYVSLNWIIIFAMLCLLYFLGVFRV